MEGIKFLEDEEYLTNIESNLEREIDRTETDDLYEGTIQLSKYKHAYLLVYEKILLKGAVEIQIYFDRVDNVQQKYCFMKYKCI